MSTTTTHALDSATDPHSALAAKILAISAAVGGIPKTGFNEAHNYAFHRDADITEGLRPLLVEHGLAIIPAAGPATVLATIPTRSGDIPLIGVPLQFTLIDLATQATLVQTWYGTGLDHGDKGLYKAYTGGVKSFLMKLFKITEHNDPEASDLAIPLPAVATFAPVATPSRLSPTEQRGLAAEPQPRHIPPVPPAEPATERQRAFIARLQDSLRWDDARLTAFAASHDVDLRTLTKDRAKTFIDALKATAPAARPPTPSKR